MAIPLVHDSIDNAEKPQLKRNDVPVPTPCLWSKDNFPEGFMISWFLSGCAEGMEHRQDDVMNERGMEKPACGRSRHCQGE